MTPTTGTEPRTAAALAARRRTSQGAVQRVHDALTRLRREKAQVSVSAVARRARVSRTFLYDNPEARADPGIPPSKTTSERHRGASGR